MKVLEALRQRQSIRSFKTAPVPQALLAQVLEAARWSPSWGNTQPWELAVVGGETLARLTSEMASAFDQKVPPNPDVPMPPTFPDAYKNRYMTCAAGIFGKMGIAREDKVRRWEHMLFMTRAYGAPAVIYVVFNAELLVPYTMFDLGSLTHAVCLAAAAHGLGTCIEAQLALYPEIVRRHLQLPDTLKIAVGLALGYPEAEAPANAYRTEREPLENLVRWIDC